MTEQPTQHELQAEVFRALRPVGVKAIHWISEWDVQADSDPRRVARIRAEFHDHAPNNVDKPLRTVAELGDSPVRRIGIHILEFEIIYGKS